MIATRETRAGEFGQRAFGTDRAGVHELSLAHDADRMVGADSVEPQFMLRVRYLRDSDG